MLRAMTNTLKHNISLIPLILMVGVGVGGAVFYPLRCALKSPDVSWDKKNNPEPWNEYNSKHYKFFVSEKGKDITESPAPKY